jgi:hypothetical protein
MPARHRGKGVAAQVALARRESAARGSRHVGLAEAMVHEMPHTMAHLEAGRVSEWRATIACRETACLSREDRTAVDAALAADLPQLGDRQVEARAKALACSLDAEAMAKRAAKAHSERRVTLRPAPDTMTHLTALLPVAQGVALFAALERAAGSARAEGDRRSRGQVMADTLVERVTGQATAAAVPVEVQLVMPAETMAGQGGCGQGGDAAGGDGSRPGQPSAPTELGGEEPALLAGHAVPAATARDLLSSARQAGASLTVRRAFTTGDGVDLLGIDVRGSSLDVDEPDTDEPSGAEAAQSGQRFRGTLRQFILLRDQTCRTPWCDAPIRHADHATAVHADGATTAANGQGLCEACNYAKEAPGWRARTVRAGPGHTVRTITPTGHTYDSTAPPLLPSRVRESHVVSELERRYEELLLAA